MARYLSRILFVALCLSPLGLLAEDEAGLLDSIQADSPEQVRIAEWVRQLDSDRFSERSDASQKLESMGGVAIPALVEAAKGDSREVTLRSLEILRKHFEKGDEPTKEAAKEGLQKLADSDHPSAARRSKDILKPPMAPGQQLQGIQIAPGQFQIQIQAAIGGGQTRRVQIAGGVKTTDVKDNDRKVKIVENPDGSIQMEVVEKVNGKETTKKYQAKNADELKKKDPKAHKLFEKYSQQNQPVIRINQMIPGGVLPGPRAIPQRVPKNKKAEDEKKEGEQAEEGKNEDLARAVTRRTAATQLQYAGKMVEQAIKRLQQATPEDGQPNEAIQRLQKIREQLQKEEGQLQNNE